MGKIRGELYPKMQEGIEAAGIEQQGKDWSFELDMHGKITVFGDFSEEEKQVIADTLHTNCGTDLWDSYIQAAEIGTEEYNHISAYKEFTDFLEKSTGNIQSTVQNAGRTGRDYRMTIQGEKITPKQWKAEIQS